MSAAGKLEAAGYVVDVAGNGRVALDIETIDSFRREFPRTKIVVMSGRGRLRAPRYLLAAKLMGGAAEAFQDRRLLKILESL